MPSCCASSGLGSNRSMWLGPALHEQRDHRLRPRRRGRRLGLQVVDRPLERGFAAGRRRSPVLRGAARPAPASRGPCPGWPGSGAGSSDRSPASSGHAGSDRGLRVPDSIDIQERVATQQRLAEGRQRPPGAGRWRPSASRPRRSRRAGGRGRRGPSRPARPSARRPKASRQAEAHLRGGVVAGLGRDPRGERVRLADDERRCSSAAATAGRPSRTLRRSQLGSSRGRRTSPAGRAAGSGAPARRGSGGTPRRRGGPLAGGLGRPCRGCRRPRTTWPDLVGGDGDRRAEHPRVRAGR